MKGKQLRKHQRKQPPPRISRPDGQMRTVGALYWKPTTINLRDYFRIEPKGLDVQFSIDYATDDMDVQLEKDQMTVMLETAEKSPMPDIIPCGHHAVVKCSGDGCESAVALFFYKKDKTYSKKPYNYYNSGKE